MRTDPKAPFEQRRKRPGLADLKLMNSNSPKLATNSLERGLAVMRMIGRQRGGMTHAELSRGLEIPKSTCTYILKRLEREGFVLRNKTTGRYKIGLDILPLAHNALLEAELLPKAKPILCELAKSTGLTATLGVLVGNRVLAIDCVDGSGFKANPGETARPELVPTGEPAGIGAEYSLYTSALGRVLLAYSRQTDLGDTERTTAHPGMHQHGRPARCVPAATEAPTELVSELEHIRGRGYAIQERRSSLDPFSIAAPVLDAKGNVRAALCIQESLLSPARRDVPAWIMMLKRASEEVSKSLKTPAADEDASAGTEKRADRSLGKYDKTNLSGFSRNERALPPQPLNHTVIRPAYLTASRRQGFGAN